MAPSDSTRFRWLDRAERVLDSTPSRLALSFLIVLSVLPARVVAANAGDEAVRWLPWVFLALFTPELCLRAAIFARRVGERRAGRWEAALLVLDLLAVLSFLPWHWILPDLEALRLFRLGRMLLLLGYWGGVVRDLWGILAGRERSRHVVFVLLGGILLSFACAVLLSTIGPAHDYDDDGGLDPDDRSFATILWWSFRQVQDPGNLVERPEQGVVVGASLLLTFGGLLLFSFLVGVGTSAVEELVARSRLLPVGLRGHTVLVGIGPHSQFLLYELAEIYRKNFDALRAAVQGSDPRPPDALRDRRLRAVRYRQGDADAVDDLARLDIRWARRVIVLGGEDAENPDARVISSTLAVRSLHPRIELFPVLEHEKSFPAARAAGGEETHLVAAGSFLGFYLAQNVFDPGIHRLYRQLLTSAGCEIYTWIFDESERAAIRSGGHGQALDLRDLWIRAFRDHGVNLVGLFVAEPGRPDLPIDDLDILLDLADPEAPEGVLDPDGHLRCAALRGLVGISLRYEDLRRLARRLVANVVPDPRAPLATVPAPEWRPSGSPLERVLVCGGSSRTPRLLELLSRSSARLRATVLVREPERIGALVEELTGALEGNLSGLTPARFPVEVRTADGTATIRRGADGDGEGFVEVTVRRADWTDVSQLLRQPDVDLPATDAILFLPHRRGRADADGLVALDCLRMAQLAVSGQIAFRPGTRILAVVDDPAKGDLLEQRLADMNDVDGRFTVVASERVRQHYVMQNLFVPGLHRFYFELVRAGEIRLRRLVPDEIGRPSRDGRLHVPALAESLCRDGWTFVGIERAPRTADGTPEVVLDPRELARDPELPWKEVRAIYVMTRRTLDP